MKKNKFKLIALDVDGTLLNDDHNLSHEVIQAVQEVNKAGSDIVLCTGRGPTGAIPVLYELGLQGTLIVHNGAAIIESESKEIVREFPMEQAELWPFIQYCRRHSIHFDLSNAFDMMLESIPEKARNMYDLHRVEPQIVRLDDGVRDDILKFTIFGSKEEIDQVEHDWHTIQSSLQPIRSGDLFMDVQHPAVSKGQALQSLAKYRGIEAKDILAIGNYFNDISMLKFAGLGVAVDNSPEKVKDAADEVGPSNNDHGVAHILRQYAYLS